MSMRPDHSPVTYDYVRNIEHNNDLFHHVVDKRLTMVERDALTSETIRIRNNANNHVQFTDGTNRWGINIDSGTGDARILRLAGTGALNLGNGVDVIAAGLKVTAGTAPPASGTWARGSICLQSQPSVGLPKSWLCTAPGTPGTWVSTGNL